MKLGKNVNIECISYHWDNGNQHFTAYVSQYLRALQTPLIIRITNGVYQLYCVKEKS